MHATHPIAAARLMPGHMRRVAVAVAALKVAAPYAGAVAGAWLLVLSYRDAAGGDPGFRAFHLFWAGILVFLCPAAYRLLGLAATRGERLALVAIAGPFLFLPKVLRDPRNPLYYDELAHWRQSEAISRTGALFQPNPIVHVAEYFPGLDSVDVALSRMTGLSTFAAGMAMLATAHLIALLGVFRLAERVLGSARLAGLAALVYGINTSFIFFDSQYSYESLAIVFFIWSLVCMAEALAAPPGAARLGWIAGALLSALACITTHHLTSYALIGALSLITIASAVAALRGRGARHAFRTCACVTVGVGIAAMSWILVVAPDVVGYLEPFISRGFTQVTQLAHRSGGGQRQLFAKSLLPDYERMAAYLAPVIAFSLAAIGAWGIRRRLLQGGPAMLGLAAFGAVYFLSLPFILTQSGSEGARRSWAFTSLGLALLVAAGLVVAVDAARRLPIRFATPLVSLALVGAIAVMAVGNTASGVNAEYRFPGAFVYGSDARTTTEETRGAVSWLNRTDGIQHRTIADRDTGLAFGTFGAQWIERAYSRLPLWQFYFRARQPDKRLLEVLYQAGTRYLIVDSRMAEELPRTGVYFVPDEPGARRHTSPVPRAALAKFALQPWAIQIYGTDHYRIYRLDLGLLGTCADIPRTATGGPDCKVAR